MMGRARGRWSRRATGQGRRHLSKRRLCFILRNLGDLLKNELLIDKIYAFKKTYTQDLIISYACMFKLNTMYRFKFRS